MKGAPDPAPARRRRSPAVLTDRGNRRSAPPMRDDSGPMFRAPHSESLNPSFAAPPRRLLPAAVLVAALPAAFACGPAAEPPPSDPYGVPGAAARFALSRDLVVEKLGAPLLAAMRNHDIELWLVVDRENNPDPLHDEVGGGFSGVRGARLFFDDGGERPQRIYIGSHEHPANSVVGQAFDEKIYYGYHPDGITPHLRAAVSERDPARIGVNTSPTLPEADGLTAGLRDFLEEALGPRYAARMVSAELLVRDFRLARTAAETDAYRRLLEWSARWMTEALSREVITPGVTTAADVAWWLQDRALELGLTGGGTVRVVREGELLPVHAPDLPILPGDILSIDGGLQFLHFAVDIKRAAYVLGPGETEFPENLAQAWRDTTAFGERYASLMIPGTVGHELWSALGEEAKAAGYRSVGPDAGGDAVTTTEPEIGVYGHSVGNVAHDIGARIADNLPFAYGDRVGFALADSEWVSIEFHLSTPIPEWDGKTWYARFEETAAVTPAGAEWLIPFQTELFLIPSEP